MCARVELTIGDKPVDASDAASLETGLAEAGYKLDKIVPTLGDSAKIVFALLMIGLFSGLTYGPVAALLVELFPARIRYTAMSLPYHIGNGWFGGLLPATSFAMVAQTGDIYYGLWYPIVIALGTAVIGFFFVPETKDRDIFSYRG